MNGTSVLEGNASRLPARRAEQRRIDNNVAGLPVDLRRPWIQDDWKVTNRLTLNLGFRWDVNGPVREEDEPVNYVFDPTP